MPRAADGRQRPTFRTSLTRPTSLTSVQLAFGWSWGPVEPFDKLRASGFILSNIEG
jgi:hypothetical protein